LALGVAVFAAVPKQYCRRNRIPSRSLTFRRLWDHALGCAMIGGAIGAAVDYEARYRYFVADFSTILARFCFSTIQATL